MIIDTHAHLFWDSFQDDFDQVIQRSIDNGVTALINVGVDVPTSEQALRLTPFVYPDQIGAQEIRGERSRTITFYSSIGIHPHEYINYADNLGGILADVKKLEDIYRSNPHKIVGVGECGLDYSFPSHPGVAATTIGSHKKDSIASLQNDIKELQKQLLKTQVNLAKQLDLPLIIHCRDGSAGSPQGAWEDIFDLVKDHYGVFHCYTGDENIAKKIQDTNFYISFSAIITYPKNDYLRQVAKTFPLNRIVVETDCPFLPPQTKRGQRNEPANIVETVQTIADVRGMDRAELEKIIHQNTKRLFKIK